MNDRERRYSDTIHTLLKSLNASRAELAAVMRAIETTREHYRDEFVDEVLLRLLSDIHVGDQHTGASHAVQRQRVLAGTDPNCPVGRERGNHSAYDPGCTCTKPPPTAIPGDGYDGPRGA